MSFITFKTTIVRERWRALSYSHQREHVEAIGEAKKPETRARRIERAARMIQLARKREPVSRPSPRSSRGREA